MQILTDIRAAERRIELTRVSTSLLEAGEGPPIVLLHGPGANAVHWADTIEGMAATNSLVAPDLPGLGESTLRDGKPTAPVIFEWLSELIGETCSVPPTLVGNALGGAVAARFAAERPDECAQVVLVDALGLREFRPAPEFARALNAFLTAPTEATHDGLWRYCAHNLPRLQQRMGDGWRTFAAYNVDRAQALEVQGALGALMGEFGLPAIPEPTLAGIEVPVRLIWGRHDLATPLQIAKEASERYGWPLGVIEDCADDPPIEQPQEFVRVLRTLISREEA
jgi:pimeloyl-ACP methyl ester carboxylesterase